MYGYEFDDWFGEDYNRDGFHKFLPGDMAGMEANYCAINIPLMRYSNVLLMKA